MGNMTNKLYKSLLWFSAIACLLVGLVVALHSTYQLFQAYNYSLGPIGDQAIDAEHVIYPVITGEKPWSYLFTPFADHRIVVERLIIIYDFIFHHGLDTVHPMRLAAAFWGTWLLFIGTVFFHKNLSFNNKLLVTGCTSVLLFSNVNLFNFCMPITATWPLVVIFSLLAFITTERYCTAVNENRGSKSLPYLFLTALFVVLTIYSFNIGLFLWPVILILLFKRQALRPHILLWMTVVALSYLAYFWNGWHPGVTATDGGMKNSLLNPIHPFLYFSRILSIPLISNAAAKSSFGTLLIGLFIFTLSAYYLYQFWRLKKWSASDTIIFAYLFFSFFTLLIISVMRSWIEAEYLSAGTRFTTISFILWLCLLVSFFIFHKQSQNKSYKIESLLSLAVILGLVGFFIPSDNYVYNQSRANQYFIALSTGIPINETLANYSKEYNDEQHIPHLVYLDAVQKKQGNGVYSLWPAQQINHSISSLSYSAKQCSISSTNIISADLRKMGSPAIEIKTDTNMNTSSPWDLLFTNKNGKIIGYSLPLVNYESVWKKWLTPHPENLAWLGMINSALVRENTVQSWFIDRKNRQICRGEQIRI